MKNSEIEKFFKAVQQGNLEHLKKLFKDEGSHQINVNSLCRKNSGDSLMHLASRSTDGKNSVQILRFLLEDQDGNIELTNLDGKTPLHDAAQFSSFECVEYLISRGANVNAVKKADWTPLMLASTKPNLPIVKILLENKADPHFVNKDGWNSFHIAVREGNLDIIEKILSTSMTNSEKRTNLCHSPSKNGRRPIHTAAMHGKLNVIQLLMRESVIRCDVDVADQCGTTALMDACRFGQTDIVDLLVEFGADLSKLNRVGMNCLHIAAEAGQTEIIKRLVEKYKLDVNCCSVPMQMTALHWAVKEEQIETIKLLIHLGASYTLKSSDGLTCLDLGRRLRKTSTCEFLEKYVISTKFVQTEAK